MSTRLIMAIPIAALGVVGLFAGSAHAIEAGPLVVPVTVPPLHAGPVSVTTDPAIGVGVATSPTKTVAIGVTPPRPLDPRTVLARPRDLVSVSVEPAAPTASSPATAGSHPVGAPAPVGSAAGPARAAPNSPRPPTDGASAPVVDPTPAAVSGAATRSAPVARAADPLNASLTREAPRGLWSSLWSVASSGRALWWALAMIALLALGIVQRMLRDALRCAAPTVSSA
jgi:hypothetical protein